MDKVAVIIYESREPMIDKISTQLKHTNFNLDITTARNLRVFLDLINSHNPYLIVMNSSIAGLGEVLLGLREKHPLHAPLILIGELEREEDFRLSIQNGAFDYISVQNIYRLANSATNAIRYELLKREKT